MKIVILGGSGYLGTKLGKYLSEQNLDVYSVVRREVQQDWAKEVWQFGELEERIRKEKVDWIINCITCYERGMHTSEDVLLANYVKPYQYFSTGMKYGVRNYITMDTGLSIDCNLYSRSKKQFADSVEWKLNEVYGKDKYVFWNIELENFYGEDESGDRFIPGTIDKLLKNEKILLTKGTQIRDFIYIEDVVSNLRKILQIEESGRINLPLGTGNGVSVHDVIVYLKETVSSQSELCFGVIPARKVEPDCVADIEKMKQYGLSILYDWKKGLKYIADKRKASEDKK